MDQATSDGSPVDVWIAGLGMRVGQVLPETIEILSASRKIFYLSHAPGVAELLGNCCNDVLDMRDFYINDVDRLSTYKRIAATVFDAAMQEPPVTFAVYGHPLVLSVPSKILLSLGPELGLSVRALPAVSSLDCLQADLGVDLVADGVQMHEATDLLLYRRRLLPEVATILWQVGVMDVRGERALAERLTHLRDWVCRYYPPDHAAVAVSSSVDATSGVEQFRFPLRELPDMAAYFHLGTTLYIAAIDRPDRAGDDNIGYPLSVSYIDSANKDQN